MSGIVIYRNICMYIWNIQLTIAINFIFSKKAEKEHLKSEDIEFMSYDNANDVVHKRI